MGAGVEPLREAEAPDLVLTRERLFVGIIAYQRATTNRAKGKRPVRAVLNWLTVVADEVLCDVNFHTAIKSPLAVTWTSRVPAPARLGIFTMPPVEIENTLSLVSDGPVLISVAIEN